MNRNVQNVKLISKIVNEVTEFYLEKNSEGFSLKIDKNIEKNEYTIYTVGKINLKENEIKEIEKTISAHHDVEYDIYWELLGEGENTDEFLLIARICDDVYMNYEERILELVLKKVF